MKKIIAIFLLYFLYFQFVLAESENMIDFKVSKILDLENVKYIAIGSYSSFAIDKNGTLYGWGLNNAEEMLLYF